MVDETKPTPATATTVKAEESKLTHDTQALDTDRVARGIRYPGESNAATGKYLDGDNPAAAQLRAFEDDRFGEDCVRINDQIEKGSGSPYSQMSDADKLHYTAMERLVIAEQKLNDANALAAQAAADRDAAQVHLDTCVKDAEESRAKADEMAAAAKARADAREAKAKADAQARANKQPAPV